MVLPLPWLSSGVVMSKVLRRVPALPDGVVSCAQQRFFELRERVMVFDPPMTIRRVYKGSFCPGQVTLWGGDVDGRNDLP